MKENRDDNIGEAYIAAFKAFTEYTINNPDFFSKSPEEQREIARNMLEEEKRKSAGMRSSVSI